MELGYLTNILIISAGVVCSTVAHDYWKTQKMDAVRPIILSMGVCAAVWNIFAGLLGFANTTALQNIFHVIYLLGMVGFLGSCMLLIAKLVKLPKNTTMRIMVSLVALGIVDTIVYGMPSNYQYTVSHSRVCFTLPVTFGWVFHLYYCISLVLFFSYLLLIYSRKTLKFRREKNLVHTIFFSTLFILALAIPDTVLPVFGIPSVPLAGIGGLVSYMMICIFSADYNAYSISVENLSNYIFNSANTGILVFDNDCHLIHINAYAQRMLGGDDLIGHAGREMLRSEENDFDDLCIRALTEDNLNERFYSMDGKHILSVSPSVIKDENQDPYCMILALNDLTKEEEMMQEVMKANRAKSSFLANMSHEVRTPINAILGMNEMILRESKDREITEYAVDIESAGRSLLSIVNDILDFSKIESGNLEILPVNYDLQSVLTDSYNMVLLRAMKKGLTVKMDCDPETPTALRGDEVRVRQIITNLLTNAVKYTETGTVTLRVRFEMMNDEMVRLMITVEDTGIGIRAKDMEDLFASFKRIDEKLHRNIEGTGLGLPVTKMLVEMMEGTIDVKSEFGVGSAFTVTIPQRLKGDAVVGSMTQRYAASQKKEAMKFEPATRQLYAPMAKVLVVDDVPMNLKVFQSLLKKTAIHVDKATSGIESLALIKYNHYDMIFMDHMMPELDGIETFHKIQEMEGHPNVNTPVVMLTANAVVGAQEEYLAEGFSEYLSKPIKPAALESILWKYLPNELVEEPR